MDWTISLALGVDTNKAADVVVLLFRRLYYGGCLCVYVSMLLLTALYPVHMMSSL